MKKRLFRLLRILLIIYVIICAILFMLQERFIFFPEKLSKNHVFEFRQEFEELYIRTPDGVDLHGILFRADSSKGLIFYLHGNAGSLNGWGDAAQTYTDLGYDVFMLDYRGYGKSGGSIKSQKQFYADVQLAYDTMKKKYPEDKIVALGYSIGTGPASKIASTNSPRLLILQSPYFNLADMMRRLYRIIPTFILEYRFENNVHIKQCRMPVIVFHGDIDAVIPYESSLKLQELFKPGDRLITLKGFGHNGMTENEEYRREMENILNQYL